MLDAIEQILPLGPEEWEQVADTHMTAYPEFNCEVLSLQRKFQSLYNSQIPTGNPCCPAHVRKAKRLKHHIEECADSNNLFDLELMSRQMVMLAVLGKKVYRAWNQVLVGDYSRSSNF
jgi:hypothetical protein